MPERSQHRGLYPGMAEEEGGHTHEALHQREPHRLLSLPNPAHHDRWQLIAALEEFDEDTPVFLKHDGGYTYGGISWGDLEEGDEDDE